MNKLLSYIKFSEGEVNESFPRAYHDPMYGGDVFKIRYRQINDLSNKRASDLPHKPVNDLLDKFGVGDFVRGKAVKDGSYYEGKIINIAKDEEGENIKIGIEVEGEIVRLAPATVTIVDDIGNRDQASAPAPGTEDLDKTQSGTYEPTTYE